MPPIQSGWKRLLAGEVEQPYYKEVQAFVAQERREHTVYPPDSEVFSALRLTPYEAVSLVLLGQDPYHDGQAHGLAFSVRPGVPPPAQHFPSRLLSP